MVRKERSQSRPWQAAAVLMLVMMNAPGCTSPTLDGYQVQAVPARFLFDANAGKGRRIFPARDILSEGAWWGDIRSEEPQSDIFITRYVGNVTLAEAQAAREVQATRYGNPTSIDYGQVAQVSIDGREAFAWMETRFDEHGAVRSLDYKAVIPYDTVTYAVEFSTSAPQRLHPDSLTSVVHSWGVAETVIYWKAIFGVCAVLVGILLYLVSRTRAPRHETAYRMWDGKPGPGSQTDDPRTSSDS